MRKSLPVSKRWRRVFAASSLLCMLTMISISAGAQENGLKAVSSPAPSATASVAAGINAEQEVRGIHEEYVKAWAQQDAAAFDRLLPDDFTLTNAEGDVMAKSDVIAVAKSGDLKVEVGKTEDVKVRMFDNAALVTGRYMEKSTYKGEKGSSAMQLTSVFVKRNGKWQGVSTQVTLIPPQKTKP